MSERRIEVRRHPDLGWLWRVDSHECSYVCGAGGCDGAGWRFTRRMALAAARRYVRRIDRYRRANAQPWEDPDD